MLWRRGNFFALFRRRRGFWHFLLRTSRRHVAVLGLRGLSLIPPRGRQGALLWGLRPLVWLSLRLVRSHLIAIWLLRSLVGCRSLLTLRLTIFRLLIVPLLVAARRRRRCFATRLVSGTLLILPHFTRLSVIVVAAHIFGCARFMDYVAHRARRIGASSGALD
jgi:hypothetical protein